MSFFLNGPQGRWRVKIYFYIILIHTYIYIYIYIHICIYVYDIHLCVCVTDAANIPFAISLRDSRRGSTSWCRRCRGALTPWTASWRVTSLRRLGRFWLIGDGSSQTTKKDVSSKKRAEQVQKMFQRTDKKTGSNKFQQQIEADKEGFIREQPWARPCGTWMRPSRRPLRAFPINDT